MAVTINLQPRDICIAPGDNTAFKIEASGNIGSYDWQYYDTNNQAWLPLGVNSNVCELHDVPISQDKSKWRCVITDSATSELITSTTVSLYVKDATYLNKHATGDDLFVYILNNQTKINKINAALTGKVSSSDVLTNSDVTSADVTSVINSVWT